MKTLKCNGEKYEGEKIIKTSTDIIGQDTNGNEIFVFRGISDFSGFTVKNEDGTSAEFDATEPTLEERLASAEEMLTMLMGV